MPDARFRVTADPLDVKTVSSVVSSADCGAVATFVGLVRNENGGRRVLWLEYEAYEPLAEKAFARIDEEAGERWPSTIESGASKSAKPVSSLPRLLRIVPRRSLRAGTRSSGSNRLLPSGNTSISRGAKSGSRERPPIRPTKTPGGWRSRNARNDSVVRSSA